MQYSSNKLSFIHYADDTTASVVGSDIRNVIQTSNYELLNVGHWLRANKLSLNVSKTNFIDFSNRDKTCNIPLKINESVVDRVRFTFFGGYFNR